MNRKQIFIITGEQGAGKTNKLLEVLDVLKKQNIAVQGFFAEGEWKDNFRSAFSIVDLSGKEKRLLCVDKDRAGYQKIGRFFFNPETIEAGEHILEKAAEEPGQLIVIDEIGLFELDDKVWANAFRQVLKSDKSPILITVRKKFLHNVISYFGLNKSIVYDVDQNTTEITVHILTQLNSPH